MQIKKIFFFITLLLKCLTKPNIIHYHFHNQKHFNNPICYFPFKVGHSKFYIPRYYFDPNQNSCEMFYYGGRGGNANNFSSPEECEKECMN